MAIVNSAFDLITLCTVNHRDVVPDWVNLIAHIIYLILILYYSLRYWRILDSNKRLAIILAVPLYVVTALIQMLIPEMPVEVVCSTLIFLGLMLSNENTEKYLDEKTMLFSPGTNVCGICSLSARRWEAGFCEKERLFTF